MGEFVRALGDDLKNSIDLLGLEGGAPGYVLAEAVRATGRSLIAVTPTPAAAESLLADLEFHLGPGAEVETALFPPYAHLPFGRMPAHPWTVARRIKALWTLATSTKPVAAVVPVQALLHRLMPKRALIDFAELILEGEEVDREGFIRSMVAGGYLPTALVEEPGDMAVRGGIIDIFGPLNDEPVRLEFFGDFVDSLRLFRPHDQRSVGRLQEAVLLPMSEVILTEDNLARGRQGLARLEADPAQILALREPLTEGRPFSGIESFLPLFYDQTAGLWDFWDQKAMVGLIDPAGVERAARDYLDDLAGHQTKLAAGERPHLPVEEIAFSWSEAAEALAAFPGPDVRPLKITEPSPTRLRLDFKGLTARRLIPPVREEGQSILTPLVKAVRKLTGEGITPWLVCRTEGQINRLEELLANYGLNAVKAQPPLGRDAPEKADLILVLGAVSAGFILPAERLVVFTEEEALGQMKVKPAAKARPPTPPAAALASYAELSPGDLVVHTEHGIGRFEALVNLTIDGRMGDYLLLSYKDDDKLYLPADRLNVIQKYIGPEGKRPPLDRLGGQSWRRTKGRVKRRLMEIARELVELYAVRQVVDGFAFSGRDELFREFEATFGYEETPDQARAINEVIKDMQKPRPMDRLVCGDVGYGKTEVALRAAFRAVMDGKQVAMLVPTTVLAEQHAETFAERLARYPINVASLSRFKTLKGQKEVLAGLEKGLVDIVIGTHRLLSKDVKFANLGLVIIDEEHRFGVNHKERLKQLRKTVDVLALTATPIPRTLQMSLLDIRDLSIIDTPPQDRQAITTYLSKFDPAAIQEAIGRELARGGQVFFVHNRIKDIVTMANFIQKLMPTARVDVAHGQMSERVLEKVMMAFIKGEIDVLVCTTIIESGLDIPAANTIIINNADKLGLAQIYQLRGRVGRAAERAYAYLLIPEETELTRDALKRLKVMMDFTHLGAGFKIAMHDLQIRGGGNLLGQAQSGQIGAVGYEMYLSLMEEAVAELKGGRVEKKIDPEIHQPVEAFLPESYISDPNQRLLLYRRLAAVDDLAGLEDLMAEMADRFGPPPEEALNLADAIRLKLDLRQAGVIRLDADESKAVMTFAERPPIEPEKLIKLVRSAPKRYQLTPDNRLIVSARNPLAETKKVLHGLIRTGQ